MDIIKTPILEGITPEEQEQMRVCFGVREEAFRAGETIYDFSEGRKYLGLIAHGSAVLQRIDRQGGRAILEHLESGGVFGEMLMFENVAGDSITVIAEEPCRVWFMQDEHMTRRCERACAHHSRLVENMFHIMTEKAAALSERVEVLSRRSIREKLLCYFGLLAGQRRLPPQQPPAHERWAERWYWCPDYMCSAAARQRCSGAPSPPGAGPARWAPGRRTPWRW